MGSSLIRVDWPGVVGSDPLDIAEAPQAGAPGRHSGACTSSSSTESATVRTRSVSAGRAPTAATGGARSGEGRAKARWLAAGLRTRERQTVTDAEPRRGVAFVPGEP